MLWFPGFGFEHSQTAWSPEGDFPIHSGTSSHSIEESSRDGLCSRNSRRARWFAGAMDGIGTRGARVLIAIKPGQRRVGSLVIG